MTFKEEVKLYWDCTLGEKSHLNIAGKILGFPFVAWFGLMLLGLYFLGILFTKKEK